MQHWVPGLIAACLLTGSTSAGPIQFVVAEFPSEKVHNDSYLISIDDGDVSRLNHARALVDWVASGADPQNSPGATIVVANVVAGEDGINRDILADGMPLWSWHTTNPINFADFTIEILDGWPTFVEQNVNSWIANTNGAVGFWGYTVVEELETVPEPTTSALAIGLSLLVLGVRSRTGVPRPSSRNQASIAQRLSA